MLQILAMKNVLALLNNGKQLQLMSRKAVIRADMGDLENMIPQHRSSAAEGQLRQVQDTSLKMLLSPKWDVPRPRKHHFLIQQHSNITLFFFL